MYGAVYLVKLLLTGLDANVVITLIGMILTGAVVYGGGMLLFVRTSCREIWGMIRG